jgi:hypothetical protein
VRCSARAAEHDTFDEVLYAVLMGEIVLARLAFGQV